MHIALKAPDGVKLMGNDFLKMSVLSSVLFFILLMIAFSSQGYRQYHAAKKLYGRYCRILPLSRFFPLR
jgi:hypothetical protein